MLVFPTLGVSEVCDVEYDTETLDDTATPDDTAKRWRAVRSEAATVAVKMAAVAETTLKMAYIENSRRG